MFPPHHGEKGGERLGDWEIGRLIADFCVYYSRVRLTRLGTKRITERRKGNDVWLSFPGRDGKGGVCDGWGRGGCELHIWCGVFQRGLWPVGGGERISLDCCSMHWYNGAVGNFHERAQTVAIPGALAVFAFRDTLNVIVFRISHSRGRCKARDRI